MFLSLYSFAQEEYGRKVVKELASSKYYGRGYIFDGDRKAAKYIAAEFKKNGVLPLENHADGYFQYLNLSPNVFPKETVLKIDGKKLKLGEDYLIDAATKSIKGDFEMVRLSVEDLDSISIFTALTDEKFIGKFIYIDENKAIQRVTAPVFSRVLDRLKKSGIHNGVVVNSDKKLVWRTLTYQIEKPVFYIKDYQLINDRTNLYVFVETEHRIDYRSQNVCGFIPGTGKTDSTLVVTAHYDHIGAIGKNVVFNGANDNASGVAMMLYLSSYFSKNKPDYNIVFLAFTGEESGLIGSDYFAKNPLIDLSKIKFLLNIDMAGTGDDGVQVVNGTIFQDDFDRLVALNTELSLLPQVLVRGPMNRSDHFPFYERGVPCFFIYTLGGVSFYHDIYDVYETLPFTNFTNYANLLTQYIAAF